jgi:Predicted acetyltransferase, GNAT superfamily
MSSPSEKTEKNDEVTVRFAMLDDLGFISQDGYLTPSAAVRKTEQGEVVVAERGGTPIGYARFEYLWSQVPYLTIIRVIPAQRKKGVARAMLAFLEEHLSGLGHVYLYSSSQADEPEPQAWHRHVGFVECGFLAGINNGGVGEVFFRKPLTPFAQG